MIPSSNNPTRADVMANTWTGGLDPLVADLNCDSKIRCLNARLALVQKGQEAVPHLIDALKNGRDSVPLEAAKALGDIGGPLAIQSLIEALEDDKFEVRWVAAEALIKLEPDSIKPLLQALIGGGGSLFLREGAHHVFRDTQDVQKSQLLAPVLSALENSVPELEVPVAAKKVMAVLELKG